MSEAMRLNESESSYFHKNANSTTAALSGDNGWVSSMAGLGGEKRGVATDVILKKKAGSCAYRVRL